MSGRKLSVLEGVETEEREVSVFAQEIRSFPGMSYRWRGSRITAHAGRNLPVKDWFYSSGNWLRDKMLDSLFHGAVIGSDSCVKSAVESGQPLLPSGIFFAFIRQ